MASLAVPLFLCKIFVSAINLCYLTGTDGILRIRVNAGITPSVLMGVEDNQLGIDKSDFRGATMGLNGGVGIRSGVYPRGVTAFVIQLSGKLTV